MPRTEHPADNGAIAVYAREPAPGRTKTRLAADVGATRAATLYAGFLRRTLAAVRATPARRYLYLPPGDHLDPGRWPLDGFRLRTQVGMDLGDRMAATFAELFGAGHERVIIVGSDIPELTPTLLLAALRALHDTETVFGPSVDGGYWLVGQRPPARELFRDIPWSTSRVWALTRDRLAEHGWSYSLLPELDDIDDGAALARHRARGLVLDGDDPL